MMRIGIVGCGLIGSKRADSVIEAGHDVIAVSDLRFDAAQKLAAKLGCKPLPDWQELLAYDIDAVIVSTTHDWLAEIAKQSLLAGLHVLVEKPAGRTAKEIEGVIAAAELANRVVMVGFNHRFHPAIWKAKSIFDSGALGSLMFLRARYGHGGRLGYEKEWRLDRSVSGGGEMIDQGAHLIDLSRWFIGDCSLDYCAIPTYFWDSEVEDNCFICLKGPVGEIAWLHASWSEWKNMFSMEIYGQIGKLVIDGLGGSYGPESLTWHKMKPEMGPPDSKRWDFPCIDDSWVHQFREFAQAVEERRQPVGNIYDAFAMFSIIDKSYRSRRP